MGMKEGPDAGIRLSCLSMSPRSNWYHTRIMQTARFKRRSICCGSIEPEKRFFQRP